ncbi:MAG: hypothetical protein KDA96_27885, partial [Planctomycetaceae bacterium]|nr:hypothetical protein [Planctomycetaceae bacterium]
GGFAIEGQLLRCGKTVTLPPVCIRTGSTDDLVTVNKTLKHAPPWAFMVGGLILVLILQKSCYVTYCISRETKKKMTLLLTIGLLVAVFGIGVILLDAALLQNGLLILVGIIFVVAGIITAAVSSSPLKISRRDGDQVFWISGCKQPFFNRLAGVPVR